MVAGHTLDDVLDDFDKLKALHASGNNDRCSRYDIVRLVTLLEQFCRIECKRRGSCGNRQWKKHRPSVQVLVDVFQMFDAKINRKKCEDEILRYYGMTDNIVPIRSDEDARRLARTVLRQCNQDVIEWMWLYTLSFQRVSVIKDKLGVMFTDAQARCLNRLFGKRHAAVHTLFEHQADRADFGLVESLFETIFPTMHLRSGDTVRPRRTSN